MTNQHLRCNTKTLREAVWVEAYLLTLYEAGAETPVFGSAIAATIATAFSAPAHARMLLPTRLHNRFDWWVQTLSTQQLDLFSQEDE